MVNGQDTKFSCRIGLNVLHGMVCHALPISDVSSAIVWGFRAICRATGALELEWLVHANDLANSSNSMNYQVVRCFLDFPEASYGERFSDGLGVDWFTTLSAGVFWWLINIHPGYLVFQQGNICIIEPHVPSQFARQFEYDQLYEVTQI